MQNNRCVIYLLRHGETDWNKKELIQGHTDIPLNLEGELEVQNLAKKLKDIKFDKVYSSDLLRAKRTAEIIAKGHKLLVKATRDLRERNYSRLEGESRAILKDIEKTIALLSKEDRFLYKHHPEIESNKELMDRFINYLIKIAKLNINKTVLVVTHGGPMGVFISILKKTDAKGKFVKINNLSYAVLEFNGKDFFIKKTNKISIA
jgi:2,3-bisphosphoglycerate-dependent phosphoglycerate mutase